MTTTLLHRLPSTAPAAEPFEAKPSGPQRVELSDGAFWLRGHALELAPRLVEDLYRVLTRSPLRRMITPGGQPMSVSMTNCGELGWVSDSRGYRYTSTDPATGKPWSAMPASFRSLAVHAAAAAGFEHFDPDACLINRYEQGVRLGMHQDRDEHDLTQPIVSVSLGVPAVFQFGGAKRTDRPVRLPLQHGDVVVWGGASRLAYHGVMPLKGAAEHPLIGPYRFNLTFRRAR